MQKLLLPVLFSFFQTLYGQKPEYIHLEPADIKIEKSIFFKAEVIDTRFDTVYMGFVQKGAFNRKAPIKLSQPIPDEITASVLHIIGGATKEDGTILINIRNFFLSELTAGLSESGTFAALSSDNTNNLFRGQGFRSNNEVLRKFASAGNYQEALDYFSDGRCICFKCHRK